MSTRFTQNELLASMKKRVTTYSNSCLITSRKVKIFNAVSVMKQGEGTCRISEKESVNASHTQDRGGLGSTHYKSLANAGLCARRAQGELIHHC